MYDNYIKQYVKAKRTTLSVQEKDGDKRMIHLFSVIELQTEEAYPYTIPSKEWGGRNYVRESTSKYSFFLAVDEISSVDEAWEIFKNPKEEFNVDNTPLAFINAEFSREPSGDCPIILPENMFTDNGIGAVLPRRSGGYAVFCQLDMGRNTEKLFVDENNYHREIEALSKLSRRWLGFDIIQKSEHLGNIYFAMSNSYFRSIDTRLSLNPVGIIYRINRLKGNVSPLLMRLIDKHGEDVAFDRTFQLSKNTGLIELPHEPSLMEQRIYNSDGDLIYRSEPAGFIRQFNIRMSVKQADVKLHVTTPTKEKDIEMEKYGNFSATHLSQTLSPRKEMYFKQAEALHRKEQMENSLDFVFFPGSKDENEKKQLKAKAQTIIRDIINKAQNTCYLCDPYFGLMDIIDYAIRIKNSGVKIKILNSKEDITAIGKNQPKQMADFIQNYSEKLYSNIEMRCLRGQSILHDRFIVTDDNIWYLGSSFNEFGSRATCIGKIEKAVGVEIIKQIEKWYFSEESTISIFDLVKSEDGNK